MESAKKQIFRLLLLILSSLLCAFALVAFMIHYYGPTGKYLTQNVLLSPDLIPTLAYQEQSSQTGKLTRFIFEGIELSYVDKANNKIVAALNIQQYSNIYDQIKKQESLEGPSIVIEEVFYNSPPAQLMINVKPEATTGSQTLKVVFQEVQFARDSHYYRVQLPEHNHRSERWVYFEYPHIYQQVIQSLSK